MHVSADCGGSRLLPPPRHRTTGHKGTSEGFMISWLILLCQMYYVLHLLSRDMYFVEQIEHVQ